jgi:hypothetical protein
MTRLLLPILLAVSLTTMTAPAWSRADDLVERALHLCRNVGIQREDCTILPPDLRGQAKPASVQTVVHVLPAPARPRSAVAVVPVDRPRYGWCPDCVTAFGPAEEKQTWEELGSRLMVRRDEDRRDDDRTAAGPNGGVDGDQADGSDQGPDNGGDGRGGDDRGSDGDDGNGTPDGDGRGSDSASDDASGGDDSDNSDGADGDDAGSDPGGPSGDDGNNGSDGSSRGYGGREGEDCR